MIVWVPLLLCSVLAGVGSWAVMYTAHLQEVAIMSQAIATAKSTALAIELTLFTSIQPAVALSTYICQNPQWDSVKRDFAGIVTGVQAASSAWFPRLLPTTQRLTPFGVVSASIPANDEWFSHELGKDSFLDPNRRAQIVRTAALNTTTMAWMVAPEVLYVRMPIFIHDTSQSELWGQTNDDSMRRYCAACYHPELKQKLWGFTGVLIDPSDIIYGNFAQLASLADQHYIYKIFRSSTENSQTPDIMIGQTAGDHVSNEDMIMQLISLPNAYWYLFMMPTNGWKPRWAPPVMVVTIIISVLASILVCLLILAIKQHNLLLHSLVPSSVVKRVIQGQQSPTPTYDAFMDNRTPANTILDMTSLLLRGLTPLVQDVMLVRTAMMQSFDLYAPMGLEQHLLDSTKDATVGKALIALVGADKRTGHATSRRRHLLQNPSGYTQTNENLLGMLASIAAQGIDGIPRTSLMEAMESQLHTAHSWDFDVFELDKASCGRPLSALAFYLLSCSGLIELFRLPTQELATCLKEIEDGYSDVNPYHNCKHAADVLQSMHIILREGGLWDKDNAVTGYVDNLTLLACYLAAAVHDFEHGGQTNDYLIKVQDPLALTYNDKSPLENHHISAAFSKMQLPTMNFLKNLARADAIVVRKLLIDLVLATDMTQHFSIVSQFGTMHRLNRGSIDGSNNRASKLMDLSTPSISTTGVIRSDIAISVGNLDSNKIPLDDHERLISLQLALKLSDLGHLFAPLNVHLRWVSALEEEFFRQGDSEKASNLLISPLFDRSKPGMSMSQVNFFEVVVIPCLKTFTTVFEGCKPMLSSAQKNYEHWSAHALKRDLSGPK